MKPTQQHNSKPHSNTYYYLRDISFGKRYVRLDRVAFSFWDIPKRCCTRPIHPILKTCRKPYLTALGFIHNRKCSVHQFEVEHENND